MALKAMVKSLDGLDDAQKALYRQEGGIFLLDVEAVEGVELANTSALKQGLQRERENVNTLEQRVAAFKDLDPDKAREALAKVESMKNWTPDDKVNELISQRTREIAAAKDQEIEKVAGSLELYRKGYEALTVEKTLTESLEKHKFLAPKIAAKLFRENVALVEKDGQIAVTVIDATGKPATRVDAKTGDIRALTIDEYIAEQAKLPEFAPLIAGNNASGTQGNNGRPQTNPQQSADPMFGPNTRLQNAKQELAAAILPRG